MILRDQDEAPIYGQRTRNTFYLADVFVELAQEKYKIQLERFLELVFGHPFKTPTREEHAMFMAYASGARSSQFGRQKNKTAWNHIQTVRRAKETVDSWPDWKRDRIVFRDKSTSAIQSDVSDPKEAELRKRTA